MYEHGNGVEKAHDKAIQYLQMAAADGNYPAQFDLASLYNEGSGGLAMDKTQERANYSKLLSRATFSDAQRRILLPSWDGGPKDDRKAIEYYTKLRKPGALDHREYLGMLFGQLGNADRAYFFLAPSCTVIG